MLSLRKTTFLILVLAFGILASVTYFTSTATLFPRFQDIERKRILGDLERVRSLPLEQSRALNMLVRDWAWWDDTYAFVMDRNQEFIQSNLPVSTFTSSAINLIGFYDTMGQVVWGAYLGPDENSLSPIPWDFEDFVFSRVAPWGKRFTGKGFQGIARMDGTLWVLACEQILTSNEEGPYRGWLLMGQILNIDALEESAKNARIHLTAFLAQGKTSMDDKPSHVWSEGGYLHATYTLHDISGIPALQLTIREPRNLLRAGKELVRLNFAIISLACFLIGSLAIWLMQKRVLGRISSLAKQAKRVAQDPNEAYDIAIPGNDEITALAKDVNGMIQQVKEEERFLDNMMRSLQVGVLLISVDTRNIVEANPYACEMIGLPCEKIVGRMCHGFVCPNEKRECPILDHNQSHDQRRRLLIKANGEKIPILKSVVPITRKGISYLLETFVSIDELERTQKALEESEIRYRTIFMNTGTASVIVNEDTTIALGNSEFYNMSGYSKEDVESGLSWDKCFHPDDLPWMKEYHRMRHIDESSVPKRYETRFINGAGEVRNVELTVALFPGTKMSIASLRDITDSKLTERELAHKAFYDTITDLPNRQLFQERLAHAVETAKRKGSLVGVLFLDIDDFNTPNEELGFEAGNTLLRQVGRRLRSSLRNNDTVARLGEDAFAILTETSTSPSDVTHLAQKVLQLFDEAFMSDETPVYLTACIGIVLYPLDGGSAESLMRNADLALLRAKASGKNMFSLYTEDLNTQAMSQLELEAELRKALESNQLEVWYQPQVKLDTGEIYAVEALVRLRRPDGSLVQPSEFIPFAEGTSLIRTIDLHVMEEACNQCMAWKEKLGMNLIMSVNLSAQPLKRGKLIGQVNEILDRTGLPPNRLEIEITEKTLMDNYDSVVPIINELSTLGVGFALDDFGTGYSSLFQLNHIPLRTIKIDKAFIDMLENNRAEGEAFMTTIVTMGESLDMRTVAKGVESQRQLSSLKRLGCDNVQGFLFSPPVKPEELEKLIRKQPFKST